MKETLNTLSIQVWWKMPIIQAIRRHRQKDHQNYNHSGKFYHISSEEIPILTSRSNNILIFPIIHLFL